MLSGPTESDRIDDRNEEEDFEDFEEERSGGESGTGICKGEPRGRGMAMFNEWTRGSASLAIGDLCAADLCLRIGDESSDSGCDMDADAAAVADADAAAAIATEEGSVKAVFVLACEKRSEECPNE